MIRRPHTPTAHPDSPRHNRGMKRPLVVAALCLAVLALTGCETLATSANLPEASVTEHPAYTLGPGDKLRVTVYEHDSVSGVFNVDDAGTISLPLVRRVSVKDMTLPEVEQVVTKKLLRSHIVDPKVSVDLIGLRPFCVLGEVRNPGCFEYIHGLTANKAVAVAGGYTYRAQKKNLTITREDGRKVAGGQDTPVFSGDVIEVPERFF